MSADLRGKDFVARRRARADDGHMLRYVCLLVTASLLIGAAPAVASDGAISPAAYNKKKCKKAKTKKQKKKYCKKKKPPRAPNTTTTNPGTTTTPGTQGTTTTQNPTNPVTPSDPQQQVVRDDAGFTNALVGSKLHKTTEGTYGYGEYTWNFCAGGQWSYRSYYYAGSTVESNDGGSYQVVEGYHAAADPNYFAGIIQTTASNGSQYRWGVELRGGGGYIKTSTSSFEEGTFTRTFGDAVC
jgi:hypothetical protein